jgi:hypothetical protein
MAFRMKMPVGLAWMVLVLLSLVACSDGDDSNNSGGAAGSAGNGTGASAGTGGEAGDASTGGSGGGAGTGGAAGAAGAPTTPDEFWTGFAMALCHRYFHCIEDDHGSRTILRATAKDESRCADLLKSTMLQRPRVAALNRAVQAGTLRMQSDWAQLCFQRAAICNYPLVDPRPGEIQFEDVTPCREVFEGTVPSGGNCDWSEECAGDAMCAVSTADAGTACAGTCTPRLPPGQDCTVDRQCGSAADEWPVCSSGKCATGPVGSPAGMGQPCDSSNGWALCADDLWCPYTSCIAPVSPSGDCGSSPPEVSQCLDGACSQGKCTAYTVRTGEGEPCDDVTAVCDSFSSLVCTGGSCVKSVAGTPCNTFFWFERALCAPTAGAADGTDCVDPNACASGICRWPHGCAPTLCSAQ